MDPAPKWARHALEYPFRPLRHPIEAAGPLGQESRRILVVDAVVDETPPPRPRGAAITVLLATAVGSSLDAMAVGVSLAFIEADIFTTALAIGCATTVMATTGVLAGRALGASFGRIAEVAGGMVLIGLGLAILRSHLGA